MIHPFGVHCAPCTDCEQSYGVACPLTLPLGAQDEEKVQLLAQALSWLRSVGA
jgi:hypothetical protein